MKPIRLTLENFGPFADSQTVDFTQLDEIFLISGPTGSGKTSLFDGMVYALYGELPGTRDPLRIKSNYTSEEGTSKVSLEFRARGKHYRIERSLIISRNRKGELNPRKEQCLFLLKGTAKKEEPVPETNKIMELNRFVVELLHLSREEFSKIILLPQGEFQQFLEEDSRGRQAIMRKLFPTEEHLRITEALNEKKRQENQELRTARAQLEELETYQEENPDLDLESREVELKNNLEDLDSQRKLLRKELESSVRLQEQESYLFQRFEEEKQYTRESEALSEQQSRMDELQSSLNLAEKASGISPYIMELERLDLELVELESSAKILEDEKDALHAEEKELEKELQKRKELADSRKALQTEIGELQPLVEKEGRKATIEKERVELSQKDETIAQTEEKLKEDLKQLSRALTSCDEELEQQEGELEDTDSLYESLGIHKTALDLWNTILQDSGTLVQKFEEYESIRKTVQVNEHSLQKLQALKDSSLASALAADLSDGSPCPVCGSTEHPAPAHLETDTFTRQEELEAAKLNLENAKSAQSGAEAMILETGRKILKSIGEVRSVNNASDNEPLLISIENALKVSDPQEWSIDAKSLQKAKKVEATVAAEKKAIGDIEDRIQKMKASRTRIQELKLKKKDLQQSEFEIRESLTDLTEKRQALRSDIAYLDSSLDSLNKDLAERSNITERIETLQSQSAELEEAMSLIDKKERDWQEAKTNNQANLQALEKQRKQSAAEKKEREAQIEKLRKKTEFKSLEQIREASMPEDALTKLREELGEFARKKEKIAALLDKLRIELKDRSIPDLDATRTRIQKLNQDLEENEKELEKKRSELEELIRRKDRTEKLKDRIKKLEQDNLALFQLADDLAGFNHRKVNFENFVLNYYLREVTDHANQRLARLSDGRYALIVNAEVEHGNRQTGLNLDILDAHTGIPRSVKSLSGGEKFLASLALALGLADVIQERAGTIEMDSLFLDEGFGTLDEEALNRAMTILEEIRENRMVGIISHVSELKRTIPCQLHVRKSSAGSSVQLVRN